MYTQTAAAIGHVYLFIPFMVTAIYLSLVNFNFELLETAKINGAGPRPGLHRGDMAAQLDRHRDRHGARLHSLPCFGRHAALPRRTERHSFGMSLGQQFGETGTWALGSAMGVVLFVVSLLVIVVMSGLPSISSAAASPGLAAR